MNQKIRNKFSGYLLQKEVARLPRIPGVISFENARSIGIIYDATSDHDFEVMKQYVKELRGFSKDVVALGFFNQKELPGTRFMKLGLDLFTRKSLDWRMKPRCQVVNSFVQKEFDILICFNLERSIPLTYITAQTKAVFKMGKYDTLFSGLFDFMIKPESQPNLKQMMDQVNHYLKLIRNENRQEA